MNWIAWLLLILVIVFFIGIIFLAKELIKKFRFMTEFIQEGEGYVQKITYKWDGSSSTGMKEIELKSDLPFEVLIGFNLIVPLFPTMFDHFGFVQAKEKGDNIGYHAIISTYMGKKPVEFILFVKSRDKTKIEVIKTFHCKPDVVCKPHLYQRLGFYS